MDKNGKFIKKKRPKSIANINPYRKVKSKFRENLGLLCQSAKKNTHKTFKLISNSKELTHNLTIVREKFK